LLVLDFFFLFQYVYQAFSPLQIKPDSHI
jgi:hypothetical protein